jgi:hypothetical protein
MKGFVDHIFMWLALELLSEGKPKVKNADDFLTKRAKEQRDGAFIFASFFSQRALPETM